MLDIYFIASILVFSILCFLEFIVFNEEILLALCFFCFIFFSFNTMGDSIFDTFQSRALKFEADLLLSFDISKQTILAKFSNLLSSRGFVSKFKVLSICVSAYLSVFTKYSASKLSEGFYSACFFKLAELSIFETKLIASFQKKCVSLLLYPLIFQTSQNSKLFIANLALTTKQSSSFSTKVTILKNLSF
jgi:hypothetical protein